MAKKIFVIYGRDVDAHVELAKFLHAVGLEVIQFESIANSLGPSPFVADVVLEGMRQADAVIALFTPDEHAALYDPKTGASLAHTDGGVRWQARPNVLFEAGVAYGRSTDNLVLAVIGADVRLFSDVSGMHFVQLGAKGGKRSLFERLDRIVGPLEPIMADWEASPMAGDFYGCARSRWSYFDETSQLLGYFANRHVGPKKSPVSLLKIVQAVIATDPARNWSILDARDFMEAIRKQFSQTITDHAYWWFVVYGFFWFDNIEYWGTCDGATWNDSVDEAKLAPRGTALIDRLKNTYTS